MKQSTRMTGVVQAMILTAGQEGGDVKTEVGSAAWFGWLEQATAFTFRDEVGHFTAHKTYAGNRRGGAYWRATRRRHGRLASYYLGPSARLTPEHLRQAAQALSGRVGDALLEQEVASTMPHHPLAQPVRAVQGSGLAPPSPLPRPLTRLLGRSSERAQLVALLRHPAVRLLTLTGPGGVGKTRLALEAAQDLVPDFADGVYFVPLSAISEPDFVLPAIAQALRVQEMGARSLLEVLQAVLRDRSLLLLLDNFEQVLPAAPPLVDLLAVCLQVKLLVTSPAALRLSGEHELTVFPLALPDLAQLPTPESLLQSAACALFVERMQAIQPAFQVTEATVRPIAEICLRLDGLPLAIELAAARTRLLSPQALLACLSHRLDLLTGGACTAPERQQTLRATIAWSYNLLAPQTQRLFRWLAVCVDGCTLSAAEALALTAGLEASTLTNEISALLENHLLSQREQPDGESRLFLLETLREFGLECLQASGELAAAQQAHARYYLALAEEAEPHLVGPAQVRWLDQSDREQENLRAVLQRATSGGDEEVEYGLRLGTALSWFWYVRGHAGDGYHWLQWVQTEHRGSSPLLARTLNQAARMAIWRDEYVLAQTLSRQSLTLYQQLGDVQGMALALFWLGDATQDKSNYAQARTFFQEALAYYQQVGDQEGRASSLAAMAYEATNQGDFAGAQALAEEALAISRERGNKQGVLYALVRLVRCLYLAQADASRALTLAQETLTLSKEVGYKQGTAAALSYIGLLALQGGDVERAERHLEEALQLRQELASPWGIARGTYYLAKVRLAQRDYRAARTLYETSLRTLWKVGDREFIASCLEELTSATVAQSIGTGTLSECVWAAQLWGVAEHLREAIGAPMPPVHRPAYEQARASAQTRLGDDLFAAAWAQGRSMTPEQALAAQEQEMPSSIRPAGPLPPPALKASPFPAGLTAREVEVLRLLAQGWTDAQIAEHLVISVRTVNRHTTSLYSKLAVSSRAAATRAAKEHHVL